MTTPNGRRLDKIRDKLIPQHEEMKVETETDPDRLIMTFFGSDEKPYLIYKLVGVS